MSGVRVCSVDDVPAGEVVRVQVGGRPIALVNLGDEGYRAVDAICSHAHYFLDEGEIDVEDETIECPKHGSVFDLNTGRPRSLPATLPVETFVVETVDHDILIEVTNGE